MYLSKCVEEYITFAKYTCDTSKQRGGQSVQKLICHPCLPQFNVLGVAHIGVCWMISSRGLNIFLGERDFFLFPLHPDHKHKSQHIAQQRAISLSLSLWMFKTWNLENEKYRLVWCVSSTSDLETWKEYIERVGIRMTHKKGNISPNDIFQYSFWRIGNVWSRYQFCKF